MKKVTDPELLKKLNADESKQSATIVKVTNPELLKLLNGDEPKPEKSAVSRFLSGVGGEVLKAASGAGELLPKIDNAGSEDLAGKYSKQGLDDATGAAGEVGKFVGSSAPYFMLPGRGIVRMAGESAGLSGVTAHGDLSDRATAAATTGALTAAGGAIVPAASKIYEHVSPLFTAKRNAVNQILKELGTSANLPRTAPSQIVDRNLPDDFVGPAVERYGYVPGVKPTAGMMTDDANLLKLEMNARVRNPVGFFERDAQNTVNVHKGLESQALPDLKANILQDQLNAKTGQLREDAFAAAEQNPTFRKELQDYVEAKAQEPGFRASKGVPLIERTKAALILKPESEVALAAKAEANVAQRTPWHSSGIDTERDSMLTAITKLGGINKDMAQSTYGNRIWEDTPNGFNVFRNNGGHSLDDISARLVEHGYLPEGAGPYDLVDAMYGNPREMFSHEKMDYGFSPEQGPDDFLRERLDSLITALNRRNTPKPSAPAVMESHAKPADIYTLRKELGDSLNLKTLAPDELTNAAKSDRRTTMEIINTIDDSLNNSSGGAWEKYLSEHAAGMKPIEQGRAFQNIIDRFETNKPIFGTDTPTITPAALRKAVDKETYVNMGKKGYVSNVDDTARNKLNDMVDVMNSIEQARNGPLASNGSPTTPFAASLMKSGLLNPTGSQIPMKVLAIINALGVTRGQNVLDDALLNPEKLQRVLDQFHKMKHVDPNRSKIIEQMINRRLQPAIAGAINE